MKTTDEAIKTIREEIKVCEEKIKHCIEAIKSIEGEKPVKELHVRLCVDADEVIAVVEALQAVRGEREGGNGDYFKKMVESFERGFNGLPTRDSGEATHESTGQTQA